MTSHVPSPQGCPSSARGLPGRLRFSLLLGGVEMWWGRPSSVYIMKEIHRVHAVLLTSQVKWIVLIMDYTNTYYSLTLWSGYLFKPFSTNSLKSVPYVLSFVILIHFNTIENCISIYFNFLFGNSFNLQERTSRTPFHPLSRFTCCKYLTLFVVTLSQHTHTCLLIIIFRTI